MLISLLGGLAIAALLTQQKFILAIQLFSGIKIAYVLPIFIVTYISGGAVKKKNSFVRRY